jgi:hypothetical protein
MAWDRDADGRALLLADGARMVYQQAQQPDERSFRTAAGSRRGQ